MLSLKIWIQTWLISGKDSIMAIHVIMGSEIEKLMRAYGDVIKLFLLEKNRAGKVEMT